jgi:hypothetical protein
MKKQICFRLDLSHVFSRCLESWRSFVGQLTGLLGVEEGTVWSLLCSYLASEFRGTSDSLKELLKDQQQVEVMRGGGGSMEPALQLPGLRAQRNK